VSFTRNLGRGEIEKKQNYVKAQKGNGSHLPVRHDGVKLLGHMREQRIVSMDKMLPRNNKMYHINENMNLKKYEKSVK